MKIGNGKSASEKYSRKTHICSRVMAPRSGVHRRRIPLTISH